MKKLFAMLLVLLVCAMALPLQALAVSVPQYIASIGVAYGRKESTALDLINDNDYTLVNKDLNDGAGGYYVYMGYKTTTDPNEAITGILIRVGKNPPDSLTYNGCTFYLVGGKNEPNGTGDGAVDLNEEAKGDYLYTYITRDLNFGNPLISIDVVDALSSTSSSTYAVNTDGNPQDLNSGAGGDTIYLTYEQFEDIRDSDGTTDTVYLRYFYLDANGITKEYLHQENARHHLDQISGEPNVSKTVNLDGYTLAFKGWRGDAKGYDPTTQTPYATYMDGTTRFVHKFFYAVYSDDVTLTYDANGGSNAPAAQTKTVKGRTHVNPGGNGFIQEDSTFTLSSAAPTHSSRCKFLGWSTDKNATTAQYTPGQQVTFKSDTTLYAVVEHRGVEPLTF